MKELKLEELTTRQKLGMAMIGHIWYSDDIDGEANLEHALELIRNHALGAVWMDPVGDNWKKAIATIKEVADYPILIMTDAENGLAGHYIGRHNSLGCTGSEELAYTFGKVTAVSARQMGYNTICNPVLDMVKGCGVCGLNARSLGGNKYKVSELAIAIARGMHDGGILTVAKHYPSAKGDVKIDSHMAESVSMATKEDLLDYYLYPYLQLMKHDLLDCIMTQHNRLPNIDPDYPASLSKKVIGVIREQGFDGVALTDAMVMMGIAAKFGARTSKGLAIENGNDLVLTWGPVKDDYEAICETYDKGLIDDERLNEAVRRVLEAQHKTLKEPVYTELTQEDLEKIEKINRDSIYAHTDEGLETPLSTDGKHFFVVLAPSEQEISDQGKVHVDTMQKGWYRPGEIMEKLEKDFPNSKVMAINEFPTQVQNQRVLEQSVDYEDVVFITFVDSLAYVGRECLTSRIVSLIEALQVTKRVSTVVHFGNPFVLEELEHIPRVLIGCLATASVNYALDVLAGKYPAKGVLTYDVHLK